MMYLRFRISEHLTSPEDWKRAATLPCLASLQWRTQPFRPRTAAIFEFSPSLFIQAIVEFCYAAPHAKQALRRIESIQDEFDQGEAIGLLRNFSRASSSPRWPL